MNLKLKVPPVRYEQIKPGQMFTDKWCKKLFFMTPNKENPMFKLGSTNYHECFEIKPEGLEIKDMIQYQSVDMKHKVDFVYEKNDPFQMFLMTNSLRQIFIDDIYFVVSFGGFIEEITV